TKAAAGMLGAHSESAGDISFFFPFARSSQLEYIQSKDGLYVLIAIDIGYRSSCILTRASTAQDLQRLVSLLKQPTVNWLNDYEVNLLVPDISKNVIGAAHIADDVNVNPNNTCEAFTKSAQVLGASIFEYCHVHEIENGHN